MNANVVHNKEQNRFEIFLDESRVGLMDYTQSDGNIQLTHTEVDPAHQGKNLAAILLRESLATIRQESMGKVVPICSYTVKYMEKHPETQDLLLDPIEDTIASCRWPGSKS